MKVIVAGSRYGVYPNFFEEKMNSIFIGENATYNITELISGCASGVDTMAINWALKNNIKVIKFPADWDKFGPKAGPIRNEQMAQYGDILIAFFNSNAENRGTKNMCSKMAAKGKKIVRFHEKLCQAGLDLSF